MKLPVFLFLSFSIGYLPAENLNISMRELISSNIPLKESDGKIEIPEGIKHVKLDIGLSYNAPMSQYWLSHEENLLVFGFEPNPDSVRIILEANGFKADPGHGDPIESKYIGKEFFVIPCALSSTTGKTAKFYVTGGDCGCSSLYTPQDFEIEQVIDVPVFTLTDFFDLFPFETHPIIDYIKLDAQGSDLDILKGAGSYLSERVVYVTVEAENQQYKNTNNSEDAINQYMSKMGFIRYLSNDTADPTYINKRFVRHAKQHDLKIYQH